MDKAQALHAFWSSFGWQAIDEQSAYDEQAMEDLGNPEQYITYEVATGSIGNDIQITASLWHRSTSWSTVTKKASQIADAIGYGGRCTRIDGGYMWIKLASPFMQRMPDDGKNDMRRLILNISVEFLTAT